jgi:hypothetical protein
MRRYVQTVRDSCMQADYLLHADQSSRPFSRVLHPTHSGRPLWCVIIQLRVCYTISHGALESVFRTKENNWAKSWFRYSAGFEEDDGPSSRDPEVSEANGLRISRVPFDEIKRHFPNTELGTEAILMNELKSVRAQLEILMGRLDGIQSHTSGTGALATLGSSSGGEGKRGKPKRKKSGSSSSSSSD